MKRIAVLPTLLTLGNLLCGLLGTLALFDASGIREGSSTFDQNASFAAWMVFLGMAFDALDGRVARRIDRTSRFGSNLDSLADLITFGILPALLVRTLAKEYLGDWALLRRDEVLTWIAALYLVCAALRLARFNAEQAPTGKPHRDFRGLPTPGAAGGIATLVLLGLSAYAARAEWPREFFLASLPLAGLVLSFLMVLTVPYPHVMNRFVGGRRPFSTVVQMVFVGVLASLFPRGTLGLAFWGYIGYGGWAGIRMLRPKRDEASRERAVSEEDSE